MTKKIIVIVLLSILSAACARTTGIDLYPGAPRLAPTYPGEVVLLRHDPRRPHIQLGEVWIKPEPGWSPAFVENKLREQAARIGAQALVIVMDRHFRDRIVARYDWRSRVVYPERVIVGVAISFR